MRRKNKKKLSSLFSILTLPFFQGFFSKETDFYLCQFLSNFLRYSFSNFPSFHPYSNFSIFLSSNFPLLNSLFSAILILSYLLTFAFICPSNFSNTFFAFSKFSFFFQMFCSAINSFHHTRYQFTPLIFLLFNIFSTFHFLTSFISICFLFSFLCPPTYSLYYTIQLIFTTRQILIEVGSYTLTILVDTTSSIVYGPIYRFTNFLTGLSLNTKSLVLSNTLSLFFQSSVSFLL